MSAYKQKKKREDKFIPAKKREEIINSILQSKESAVEFLVEAGIVTKDGKLKPVFDEG